MGDMTLAEMAYDGFTEAQVLDAYRLVAAEINAAIEPVPTLPADPRPADGESDG